MQSFCIELRDMIDIAAKAYVRMGPRQLGKLLHAFEEAFEYARVNGRGDPKLEDVGAVLDEDLQGIIGDLFRFEFFGDGPPFGDLVDDDTVFNFDGVPRPRPNPGPPRRLRALVVLPEDGYGVARPQRRQLRGRCR